MPQTRIVLLRKPAPLVFSALRDHMPAVGEHIKGIVSIRRVEATKREDGELFTVHEWTASSELPQAVLQRADAKALTWIERTTWDSAAMSARWTMESCLLGRALTGAGTTRLTPAMGNAGTRIHFEMEAKLDGDRLGPLAAGKWADGISDAASAVLAKTLQDVGAAIELFLESKTGATSASA